MTFVRTLGELSRVDIETAGGKGANLGELTPGWPAGYRRTVAK
jgi:phosphoenolpyruvate synthase/pyruvate phosphate dikinase